MTDTTPEAVTTPPQDPIPDPAPQEAEYAVPTYQATPPKGVPGTGHYSVWDTSLERYVGERTSSKPSAADARKLAPGGYRIVET